MKMNQTIRTVFVALGLILLLALAAQAQVPQMMSYQGRVTAGGTNVNGTGYFKFVLVDSTGIVLYWSHDGTAVFPPPFEPDTSVPLAVADGLFSVMLGGDAMNALHNSVFLNNDAHLRVWFSEDDVTFTQLTPDQPLGSVGYAALAAQVSNGAIGENQLVSGAVTVFKIANGAVTDTKLAAGSVTAAKIVNGTITSNKIDWSTMPGMNLKGYAESGAFATAPVASGDNAIAMGYGAVASEDYAVVGGGIGNTAGSYAATVAGGDANTARGAAATVGGGESNAASNEYATVSGGARNVATGPHSTVGGGYLNRATNTYATVSGGASNTASGAFSTIGGGERIVASEDYASVGGGIDNTAGSYAATVAGGDANIARGAAATVGGGESNVASNEYATVSGGSRNTASRPHSTVGGGYLNHATGTYATVSGGVSNRAIALGTAIGGGASNTASSVYATVGGGRTNTASGLYATVSGGDGNTASGFTATVGGGDKNTASGTDSTIGGGIRNAANGTGATVGGGLTNVASGTYATIPGGRNNLATNYAFAAGRQAKANHQGAFVWADSTSADIASTNNNSVTFRAAGGYRLFSSSGATLGAQLPPSGTSWSALSDREAKENFEAIDTGAILDKLAALPVTAWNYKADPDRRRYIGPVAQDFHAAFGLGNDTTINTLDADGVALAAIQGLAAEVREQRAEVNRVQEENAELKARIDRLEALIAGVE